MCFTGKQQHYSTIYQNFQNIQDYKVFYNDIRIILKIITLFFQKLKKRKIKKLDDANYLGFFFFFYLDHIKYNV